MQIPLLADDATKVCAHAAFSATATGFVSNDKLFELSTLHNSEELPKSRGACAAESPSAGECGARWVGAFGTGMAPPNAGELSATRGMVSRPRWPSGGEGCGCCKGHT